MLVVFLLAGEAFCSGRGLFSQVQQKRCAGSRLVCGSRKFAVVLAERLVLRANGDSGVPSMTGQNRTRLRFYP